MTAKKQPKDMSDKELVDAYETGTKWLIAHEQVSDTTKDASGGTYNQELWYAGLERIEKLEDEMRARGLQI